MAKKPDTDRKTMADKLAELDGTYENVEAKKPTSFEAPPKGVYEVHIEKWNLRESKDKATMMASLQCKICEGQEHAGRNIWPTFFIKGENSESIQASLAQLVWLLDQADIDWKTSRMTALMGCMDRLVEADVVLSVNHTPQKKNPEMYNDFINAVVSVGGAAVEKDAKPAAKAKRKVSS